MKIGVDVIVAEIDGKNLIPKSKASLAVGEYKDKERDAGKEEIAKQNSLEEKLGEVINAGVSSAQDLEEKLDREEREEEIEEKEEIREEEKSIDDGEDDMII